MDIRGYLHDSLHSTQWGANLICWWHTRVRNHRSRKDLIAYHKEVDDKVWLMRSRPCDDPEAEARPHPLRPRLPLLRRDLELAVRLCGQHEGRLRR